MTAGLRLAYRLTGNPDGPLAVFLHGFLGTGRDWDPIIAGFEDECRCLTIDLPGHGESRIAPGTTDCGFAATSTAIMDLVDETDAAAFSLVGYSMGGRLALYLAGIYAMRIDHLVLESASPGLRTAEERRARREHDEGVARRLETQDLRTFLAGWYRQPLFASLQGDSARLAALIERRRHNDGAQLAAALRGLGAGAQPSLWTEWGSNHAPTLLVAGEWDGKYASLATEMAHACTAARVAVIPACGHNVHFENPSGYTILLRSFLLEQQE